MGLDAECGSGKEMGGATLAAGVPLPLPWLVQNNAERCFHFLHIFISEYPLRVSFS